jgi:hypothetical protein
MQKVLYKDGIRTCNIHRIYIQKCFSFDYYHLLLEKREMVGRYIIEPPNHRTRSGRVGPRSDNSDDGDNQRVFSRQNELEK